MSLTDAERTMPVTLTLTVDEINHLRTCVSFFNMDIRRPYSRIVNQADAKLLAAAQSAIQEARR